MMPRIMANIAATVTIMGHTKLFKPDTRTKGNAKRVRMPNMSEAMARWLVLTFIDSSGSVGSVKSEPQEEQT
jgi:hypothetical protein